MLARNVGLRTFALLTFGISAPGGAAVGQDVGDFTAEVRGAAVRGLAGFAKSWGSSRDNGWYVQLWEDDDTMLLLLFKGATRPIPGDYRIVGFMANDATPPDGRFITTVSVTGEAVGAVGFHSTEGVVHITSSTPGEVTGSFAFRAVDSLTGRGTVTVDGSFRSSNEER